MTYYDSTVKEPYENTSNGQRLATIPSDWQNPGQIYMLNLGQRHETLPTYLQTHQLLNAAHQIINDADQTALRDAMGKDTYTELQNYLYDAAAHIDQAQATIEQHFNLEHDNRDTPDDHTQQKIRELRQDPDTKTVTYNYETDTIQIEV